jgi:hypothetical protein
MLLKDEKQYSLLKSICILSTICILCLIPFLNKAFHIDDPLFVWTAKQIIFHPLDFYGFNVNWYGWEMPISEIAQNPPLASYYIALVAYCFGWSEIVLHTAFLLPACVVVIGTYLLAKDLCERPLLAALISTSTPVFLLSSTTIMCDILMLSFWITSINLWRRGVKTNSNACFVSASFFIAACGLTKYYGISLIPLLFIYSLAENRKFGWWIFYLIIPFSLLGGYQLLTQVLYGRDHILSAASYAMSANNGSSISLITKTVTGLSFIGGCFFSILFYTPIIWRKFILVVCGLLLSLIITVLMTYGYFDGYPFATSDGINWIFVVQLLVFVLSGICLLIIVCQECWYRRDSDSLLITLWTFGTVIFALFVNWTVNGRSLLPIVPVVGICIVWKLSRKCSQLTSIKQSTLYVPLIPAFLVALLVTWSDYKLANSARDAASKITHDYSYLSEKMCFEGHWGFQYYMQMAGIKSFNFEKPNLSRGDIVVIPSHQSGLKVLHKHLASLVREYEFGTATLLTMNGNAGAGFYANLAGGLPLPFAVGNEQTYKYYVFKMIIDKKTRFTY